MNILVIYRLPLNSFKVKRSIVETEKIVKLFATTNNIYFWNYIIPAGNKILNFNWDLVFIMSSALSDIQFESQHKQLKSSLNFLKKSEAMKIVLPQDEYYASEDLENLFIEIGANIIITLHLGKIKYIYPKIYMNKAFIFISGHTTYNDLLYLELSKNYKILDDDKKYDLVYRASKPTVPNPLALSKFELGNRLHSTIIQNKLDLKSNLFGEILNGNKWYEFLSSSRATPISPSGSNVIFRRIEQLELARVLFKRYKDTNLEAIFDIVGVSAEDKVVLTALSPRNFEAAALGVIQLLIKPTDVEINIDQSLFLILDDRFRDLNQLRDQLYDKELVQKLKNNAFQKLVLGESYSFKKIWNQILNQMVAENRIDSNLLHFEEKQSIYTKKFYFFRVSYEKYFFKQFIKLLKRI